TEVHAAEGPKDSRDIGDGRIGPELVDKTFLERRKLIARYIRANPIKMPTSPAFDNHAWRCTTRFNDLHGACYLLIAICIGKESARTDDIFAASAVKIGFVDGHKDAYTPLRRIERVNLGPHVIERAMKNFCVALFAAIAEELKCKLRRSRIEGFKEFRRHGLVMHWRGYSEIGHCGPITGSQEVCLVLHATSGRDRNQSSASSS